jgi:hypothetical protein
MLVKLCKTQIVIEKKDEHNVDRFMCLIDTFDSFLVSEGSR